MSKYKVDVTGLDTSSLNVLTSSEMIELFKKYKKGDLFARDLLIEGNFRLVLSILKRFYNKIDNLDDLFQVGCVGLIKAIDNFDLEYNVQFSTYAVPMIIGEVKRYLRDDNSIRVSRSLKDIAYKAMKFMDDYYQNFGREADCLIIANELGVSEYDVSNAINSMKEPVSMYEPIYNDGGDTIYLYDQIIDESFSSNIPNRLEVENAISNLNERERYILDQRFIIGKTQMEVAQALDISQAQISRLEKKAVKELKKVLN